LTSLLPWSWSLTYFQKKKPLIFFNNLWIVSEMVFKSHFTQEWFVSSLIKFGQLVQEKTIFNIKTRKMAFPIVAPPYPRGLWSVVAPSYPRGPWSELTWIWTMSGSVLVGEHFLIDPTLFSIFVIISFFKRVWPFILSNRLWVLVNGK
jgi:hypothetical protein